MFNQSCDNEEEHLSHRWWINYGDMGDAEYTCPGAGMWKL
ncbi:hypothetical protein QCN36_gp60 [Arthrobacter phage CastorTray]|uniref:Uncharacterized protein n=1 Tax=Arthrobacter phage CastorTray TaxID=2859632 RepID=A0AAE7WDR7_9CAUD|nr:hypothetical protein QCN36_gp60 [Arthrobacter phage CastorTray]QYC55047.1 hypothetical protein SEA_CASTORTRAY_60 [Arthrobacter phage CastorTray]